MVSGDDRRAVEVVKQTFGGDMRAKSATLSGKPSRVPVIPAFYRCVPGPVKALSKCSGESRVGSVVVRRRGAYLGVASPGEFRSKQKGISHDKDATRNGRGFGARERCRRCRSAASGAAAAATPPRPS